MTVTIKTSYGELVDKITILEIKNKRIDDQDKLNNIQTEMKELNTAWQQIEDRERVEEEKAELKNINEALWEIEDAIREKELNHEFDKGFIELARSVYITNDQRAAIKKQINKKLGSEFMEEKSYKEYGRKKL